MKFVAFLTAALLAFGFPVFATATERVVLTTDVRPERYEIRVVPDAANLSFEGRADIALRVVRPTDRIVLNAADLKILRASLSGRAEQPRIEVDAKVQTAAFVFVKPLAPGRYTLSIDYAGKIYQQASGLFALDYDGADGAKKRALFTQFEVSDGRRFAPMWDEPGVKAVFSLTVEAPADQMAISNMPAAQTTTVGGKQTVRFADSPKMSSYLLFLALGDFERISQKVGEIDVGVVVRKGDATKGRYALDAAVKLLPYFNDWFDTPYPLPKLDLVAGPGNSQFFAAMENWGAIFYFDHALLIDPALSTEADKQNVFTTVAHEMAHQWFGNLVTMAWWDDLWLNESFASWMEIKATNHFHPEWNLWLSTQSGQQTAMRLDSRAGTHPIITAIPDAASAATAFDTITYQKGQAVIRMLEAYVGEDDFRAGLRAYMKRHAYGNTVSDDLWTALDAASPKDVVAIARDFTRQDGVPLIRVAPGARGLVLTQGRFGAETSQRAPRSWRTPVAVKGLSSASWEGIVRADTAQFAPVSTPAVVNAGQTGYFRTAYAPELWASLAPLFGSLDPADQLGLLYDSHALGEAGYGPMSDFLSLARNAPVTADPIVLHTLTGQLESLDGLLAAGPVQGAFRAFATSRLRPIGQRVGWDAKTGENDNEAILRRRVLVALGRLGDPAVAAEAQRRFEAWLADPDSLRGAGRRTVLDIVAANADARIWQQLRRKARESEDVTDRGRLYRSLGVSRDRDLARKALDLALSGEPSPTEAPGIVAAVAGVFPDLAYDFAIANRTRIEALLEPTSRVSYFTELAMNSRDAAMLAKLDRLAETIPASGRGEIEKSAAAIRYRQDVIARRVPEIQAWLAAQAAG